MFLTLLLAVINAIPMNPLSEAVSGAVPKVSEAIISSARSVPHAEGAAAKAISGIESAIHLNANGLNPDEIFLLKDVVKLNDEQISKVTRAQFDNFIKKLEQAMIE